MTKYTHFQFELFTIHFYDYDWFVGIFGIEFGDYSGHLFYIEKTFQFWKFDVLFLRWWYYKWLNRG